MGHFHGSDLCKAKGQQCHSCHKRDHFAHVCFSNKRKDTKHNSNYTNRNTPSTSHASFNKTNFSKTDNRNNILSLNNVTRDSDSSDEFLFKISGSGVCNDVFVFVDNFKCPFQVDSGASCNIMDYGTFVQMCETQPFSLGSDGTRVFPYGSSEPLCLKGHFYANLTYGKSRKIAKILVSSTGNSGCLLGRKTAVDLGLLNLNYVHQLKIDNVRPAIKDILNKYANIFEGLGKLKGVQLKLNIDPSVAPVTQHLRRIPFHVRGIR